MRAASGAAAKVKLAPFVKSYDSTSTITVTCVCHARGLLRRARIQPLIFFLALFNCVILFWVSQTARLSVRKGLYMFEMFK